MRAPWVMLLSASLNACALGSANAPSAVPAPAQVAAAAPASPMHARSSSTRIGPGASVWFHPLPPGAGPPGDSGSADFFELFAPGASWPRAAARTNVFGLYAGSILGMSDGQLRAAIAFFNAHNMEIELEAPALQALATCGTGVEGYAPYGVSLTDFTLAYLQRLRLFGGRLSFVKADEPYYFGSVVNDPRSCHFPVTQVVKEFHQFALLVKSVYPGAQVGDVEPIIASAYTPDPITAIGRWHDTYRETTGRQLPFYIADMDFGNAAWPELAIAMENATHGRGMHFGIIYSGDFPDVSDAEWSGKAVARFQLFEGTFGGRPDYALFQSWMPHPARCLPETDPTTFTGVLDAYFAVSRSSPIVPDSANR